MENKKDLKHEKFIKSRKEVMHKLLDRESELVKDTVKKYKLPLNLIFYMSAFPEYITDSPPHEILDKTNKNNSKTIKLSSQISDYLHENRDISPHLRRGHFRYLSSMSWGMGIFHKYIHVSPTVPASRARSSHFCSCVASYSMR